ncbi:MAG: adenosine kinase [Actinomycetota bacterium]
MDQHAADEPIDVVGIGNALVDVISHETDEMVADHGLVKGSMNLIETERAEKLYADMGAGIEVSGGSAANTMVGVASFGGTAAYFGKVCDDQLGEVFLHDLKATGVEPVVSPAIEGAPTGRCLILVTPDAERTMNTYLGASVEMHPSDIDDSIVRRAREVYLEGYLWDRPDPQEAMLRVARVAREGGARVSLTLSDSFCVDRHRESFLTLVEHEVDLLFANTDEIRSLYEVDDLDAAVERVRQQCDLAAITMSAEGSLIVTPDDVIKVDAEPVERVLDTTGAGDLYAAGFLFGLAKELPLELCGRLASIAAAEVISHVGARPAITLHDAVADLLG